MATLTPLRSKHLVCLLIPALCSRCRAPPYRSAPLRRQGPAGIGPGGMGSGDNRPGAASGPLWPGSGHRALQGSQPGPGIRRRQCPGRCRGPEKGHRSNVSRGGGQAAGRSGCQPGGYHGGFRDHGRPGRKTSLCFFWPATDWSWTDAITSSPMI